MDQRVREHHSAIITFLHRFFGIKDVESTANRCEIKLKLVNKFVADMFVTTPKLQLRRINQELPFAMDNYYFKNRIEMVKRFYGKSHKRRIFINTTDWRIL
jgi:hypothetical protein